MNMKYKSLLSVFLLASHACAVLAQDVIPQRYPVEKQSQGVEEIRVRTEHALMYDSVPEPTDSLTLPPSDSIPEAHALSWSDIVKERLAAMAREADQANFNTGLCVYDLTGDSLLFTYNHNKVMRPASTQKILTAVSALDLLGKNYFFKTRTYYDGTIQQIQQKVPNPSKEIDSLAVDSIVLRKRVLRGNIYVVGDFDPLVSYSDLKDIARAVRELGIDSIDGRIVGDVSVKDTDQLGNGWCWDDVPSRLIPYLSPLIFNHEQSITSSSSNCIPHPEEYFVQILASEIRALGIGVRPFATEITSSPCPRTRLLHTITNTLESVLERMMKRSDNLHAEAVFYQLAKRGKSAGATWKDGAKQVESVLSKAGVSTSDVKVADGSGVSLYNYVSAWSEVKMLRYAYRNKQIFTPLYESMPIAGVDGTISDRMRSGAAYQNVHAKTGTVTGVSCLSGYVRASNGNLLAFAIINNGNLRTATGHNFQDRICQILAK